ncbi:MAG: cyclase family protein [Longimicrobiales bacterium]|nr:cyclase family protein [Longimicrobiales bacterium]
MIHCRKSLPSVSCAPSRAWLALPLMALLGCGPELAPPPDYGAVFGGGAGRWVDLTYAYSEESIYWPTAEGFKLEEVAYAETEGGRFYASYNYSASEHGGTHLDAPIHFARGGDTNEKVGLERLIGPAAVVDVSDRAHADYQVSVEDLQAWEARHGPLPNGVILLLRTGWGERWPDPVLYLGTDKKGPEAVPELHFPGLAPEAARWLVENRAIAALGIDTPSIDFGQSATFETHQVLYARNVVGFENVAHEEELPEWGAFVVALPMKIQGGSGGPLRIVAFLPGEG